MVAKSNRKNGRFRKLWLQDRNIKEATETDETQIDILKCEVRISPQDMIRTHYSEACDAN